MRCVLVVVLCVVVKGQNYGQNQYIPVIKDGVPEDTPEVQAAKAAHFEAYERARVLAARKPSDGQYEEEPRQHQVKTRPVANQRQEVQRFQPANFQRQEVQRYQPEYHQRQEAQRYQPHSYQQQTYQPQSYQQPEYFQAQYQNTPVPPHYQSNVIYDDPREEQYSSLGLGAYASEPSLAQHYRSRRGILTLTASAAPEATPEVQAAKYEHFLAHASAHEEDDDDSYPAEDHQLYHIPIITKKGVPVNTASVKVARQRHQLAHYLAKTGVQYKGGYSVYIPVISPNGVPYDTPEVYLAKAQHLIAHAKESTKHKWGLDEGY